MAEARKQDGVGDGVAVHDGVDGRADFELATSVGELEPDFDGGGAGVERGADERDGCSLAVCRGRGW